MYYNQIFFGNPSYRILATRRDKNEIVEMLKFLEFYMNPVEGYENKQGIYLFSAYLAF